MLEFSELIMNEVYCEKLQPQSAKNNLRLHHMEKEYFKKDFVSNESYPIHKLFNPKKKIVVGKMT